MFDRLKKLRQNQQNKEVLENKRIGEFKKQEQLGRLTRIMNKLMKVFEEEKLTVPEGLDIVGNLVNHFNRDVIRILNQAENLKNTYDRKTYAQESEKNNTEQKA